MRSQLIPIARWLFCVIMAGLPMGAAAAPGQTQATLDDHLEPRLLTGTIYETGVEPKRVLFTFRRTATRSGPTVSVLREYHRPDGSLGARERVTYEAGKLASYELEELQAGASGKAVVRPDPARPGKEKFFFDYTEGEAGKAKKKSGDESLQEDTLINDTIGPFIQAHFDELMKGRTVKFRFIALARAETVGFKLVKEAETVWHQQPAVRLRMEASSVIIAQLVDPLFFTVERGGAHRVLQYEGRTTPKIKRQKKWEDLDAVTVFDWK
jgi:hypothetical protein